MNGPPIENGAVEVSGDRIIGRGKFDQIKRNAAGDVIDVGEQILLPGLINAHCHLDYTLLRGRISPKRSFTEWVRAINAEKEKLSLEDYIESINAGIAEAATFGTTSIVNFEAFPELASQITAPLRIWWLAELLDIRAPQAARELIADAVQSLEPTGRWGLAPHSPFTASESLYQICAQVGSAGKTLLSTHVAESRDEMAMFRDGSGPLHQFLESIGRNIGDCGKQTPIGRFLAMVSTDKNDSVNNDLSRWIVAHLNELSEADFAHLEQIEPKFSVVHCPRSHRYFGHSEFAFERLRRLGFNICLGTDSLASNHDLNLFAEMRVFGQRHPGVLPRQIVEMITVNPACALGQQNLLGRIDEGSLADLIAIPDGGTRDPFEAIISHEDGVNWVMVAGIALGD